MSLAKKFATFVAPVALAAGFSLAANDAAALDLKPGQCLPAAEMMSQLKAEGQRSVILANRIWSDVASQKGGRKLNVFTSNASGDLGYQIEAEDSFIGSDKPATKFCLVSDYTNVHLYDARGSELPSSVPKTSNLAKIVKGEMEKRGLRPMLVFERNGATFVLSSNPDVKDKLNAVVFVGNSDPNKPASSDGFFAQTTYSSNIDRDKLTQTSTTVSIALNAR